MNIDNLLKIATVVVPLALTAFATLVILKEKSKRVDADHIELKEDVKEFVKEFRNCISILNTTSERQAVLQKITNDTMLSLISKLEHLEEKVQVHTTKLAILEKERTT